MVVRQYSKEEKEAFVEEIKTRTKTAALSVIRLFQQLPKTKEARILGRQLMRSATSVAANYRAVCRARSPQEQYAKLCICVEEADETLLWLEMLREANIVSSNQTAPLEQEYARTLAVLAKARKNSQQPKS
jgi:four helix bundle protein